MHRTSNGTEIACALAALPASGADLQKFAFFHLLTELVLDVPAYILRKFSYGDRVLCPLDVAGALRRVFQILVRSTRTQVPAQIAWIHLAQIFLAFVVDVKFASQLWDGNCRGGAARLSMLV